MGPSRKSFIGVLTGARVEERLPGTLAAVTACVLAGARAVRTHDVAAMIFPTTPLLARPIGDDETVELNGRQVPTFLTYIRNTDPASNAGIPGLSLPITITGSGLPVGMELDAPAGHDHRLLSIGLAYQASLPALPDRKSVV